MTVYFLNGDPLPVHKSNSGLIAVENDSGLLLALVILDDSAPTAEETVLHGTLLDFSAILTIEKGNRSIL